LFLFFGKSLILTFEHGVAKAFAEFWLQRWGFREQAFA
jgi:hypothetical protein